MYACRLLLREADKTFDTPTIGFRIPIDQKQRRYGIKPLFCDSAGQFISPGIFIVPYSYQKQDVAFLKANWHSPLKEHFSCQNCPVTSAEICRVELARCCWSDLIWVGLRIPRGPGMREIHAIANIKIISGYCYQAVMKERAQAQKC